MTAARADTIDRHPELKSRALAWTEYDGSYLVDTSSRGEMLDLYWTVFSKPYPDRGWTGSVNPPVAGTTSELGRIREYAQLNAYRALNGSPAASEDPTRISYVQSAALVFALNPDHDQSHAIDNSWVGYSATAADAARNSLLDVAAAGGALWGGAIDSFIEDGGAPGSINYNDVGHRMTALHDNSTSATVGFSQYQSAPTLFNAVWYQPIAAQSAPIDHYIAYPSAGFFPKGLMNRLPRWSFVPANDFTDFLVGFAFNTTYPTGTSNPFVLAPGVTPKDTTVTAKLNGVDVAVHALVRNNPPGPLTWDFVGSFDPSQLPDGSAVEITVHDVAIEDPSWYFGGAGGAATILGYRDYQYTVTVFDENTIAPATVRPKTPFTNISTRCTIGGNQNQLIGGFTVIGTTPVKVALRAQGPGLAQFGIRNVAKMTHLRLYDEEGNMLGENSGWKNHPDWRLLQSSKVAPSLDAEAAMVATLWPGKYTAIVSDETDSNGVGMVEAFNIDGQTETQFVNLSTRGLVGQNESQMIAGISIQRSPRTVVIRTQGPGLAQFGITNPVADTVLKVVDQADGHTVAQNDDWASDPANARLLRDLASYAPSSAKEAALVLTLRPGSYTALVSSHGAAGVGIVEVFDVTP